MKKTKFILLTAVVLSLFMTSCGGGGGESVSEGGNESGPIQLKDNQYVDFRYDLNDNGNGIVITGYTGAGGKVTIPEKIENIPVMEIGENAFRGRNRENDNLRSGDEITSVIIPNGVRKIGQGAFADCRKLTDVTLPDTVEEIREIAFRGCTSLVSANIPAGLKVMGLRAFSTCGELSNLTIPAGTGAIDWQGANHFANCGKLPSDTQQRLRDLGYADRF